MPAKTKKKNLYHEAVIEGTTQHRWHMEGSEVVTREYLRQDVEQWGVLGPEGPGYWIARHAARQAVLAMLKAASKLKVTPVQYEALRQVAADVAFD